MHGAFLFLAVSSLLAGQTAPSPTLSYSTYLRGGFAPLAMAADTAGNVYLAGSVRPDPLAFETSVLAIKLNREASEYVYVSLINGLASASPRAIAVDGSGNVWITGQNSIPSGPAHPDTSAQVQQSFLTKLDPSGAVLFSKTYSGPAQSYGQAIRVTPKGEVLVSGLALIAITAPIVRNRDGKQNSCNSPAKPGSVVSFFVNGVGEGGIASGAAAATRRHCVGSGVAGPARRSAPQRPALSGDG